MNRLLKGLVAGLVATVALVAMAGPALAADEITIRSVDTREFPAVRISAQIIGEAPELGDFQVRENGVLLEQQSVDVLPITDAGTPVGVVLAIDVSRSMRTGDALDLAKAAAKRFVSQAQPNVEIALVAFGTSARSVVNFTSDRARVIESIDELAIAGETAIFDAVRKSVALYQDRPELQPNVVLLSDGGDTASTSTRVEAVAAAKAAKSAVFTIGIEGADFDAGFLRSISDETGGAYVPAADPTALEVAYDAVQQNLENQYLISYTSQATTPDVQIIVAAGGVRDTATATVGSLAAGQTTEPEVVSGSAAPDFLSGTIGKVLVIVLALTAVALASYAIILLFVRLDRGLDDQLRVYTEANATDDESSGIMQSSAVQQAVGIAERFSERQGFQPRIESMLEQAHVPLRAGEALFFYVATVVVVTALVGVVTRNIFGLALGFIISAVVPPAVLSFMAAQRKRKFMAQLPDTLQLLSGSLRAGYSLMQGVEAVSQEVDDPMGRELRRIVAESRLGLPLEDALDQAAERMGSDDFNWAVMAIKIQREVGGNLAELLDTVAETMIERERLRRDVRALTAEGRISAIILGIMPLGLLAMIWALNPDYLDPLFNEFLGQVILIGGGVLALVGFYWMKKIVDIDL